jgi:uncharacterized membrane protein
MSEMPPPTVPPAVPPPPGGGSYSPPPPPPPGGAPASSDRTIMLVLSYLGLLALIPLLTKKDDQEVQWHAKNGLALFVAEVVIWIGLQIVIHFLPAGVGCGAGLIGCVIWLAFLVIWILCIMKAVQGQRFRIPVITDMAEKM